MLDVKIVKWRIYIVIARYYNNEMNTLVLKEDENGYVKEFYLPSLFKYEWKRYKIWNILQDKLMLGTNGM